MAFVYPEVTISAVDYDSFSTVASADSYFAARLDASAWTSATADNKAKALRTATLFLDRQRWQGDKTDAANALSWPRTDLEDVEGEDLASDSLPAALVMACQELALALLVDPSILGKSSATGSNVSSVQAGSVGVSFFKGVDGTRFPQVVQERVGLWLGSAGSYIAGRAYGTDEEAQLDEWDRYARN